MHLHEYQSKKLIREYDVPTPKGEVATTPEEASDAYQKLPGARALVKAQVHAGGRGKAGGIQLVESPEEAHQETEQMLGSNLVTHQTDDQGKPIEKILLEEGVDIKHELYVGITLNREEEAPELMVSPEGGMEIETLATEHPEKIYREVIHPTIGIRDSQLRSIISALPIPDDEARTASKIFRNLTRFYTDHNCTLLELNPLAVTEQGELLALDCKINVDDRSLYLHDEVKDMRDEKQEDPTELRAQKYDLSYINLEGNIGCLVNGAGLAMATMDIIKLHGGEPANFLDVGGGAGEEQVRVAFEILLEKESVEAVLVNIFGGIMSCAVIARGMIEALSDMNISVPLVVRLEGTDVEEGRELLENSDLEIIPAQSMNEAARKAVESTEK